LLDWSRYTIFPIIYIICTKAIGVGCTAKGVGRDNIKVW
jgi:hypothetical protein